MRELSVQAANDTLDTNDRGAIASELTALKSEIDRISNDTQFNSKKLLNGSLSSQLNTAASNLAVGAAASATAVVSAISVSSAQAGTVFTFAGAGNNVTLSATIGGASVSQTLTVADMTAGGLTNQTLDFNTLGVKVSLSGVITGANAATYLNTKHVDTQPIGTGAAATFQVGAYQNQTMSVVFDSANSSALLADGTKFGAAGGKADLATAVSDFSTSKSTADATALIQSIDKAIADVSKNRSTLGAAQNRLEHTIENLSTSSENLTASESRIRDADMAQEMVGFTRSNILQQAGTSVLAQANQLPQSILSLLK